MIHPSRRPLTPMLLLLLLLLCTTGCGQKETVRKNEVTVSIEPERYFAEKIAGDLIRVHVLVPAGANPETYDPTPRDIAGLAESDIYFHMGSLGFEKAWLPTIREQNKHLCTVDLSAYLPEDLERHLHFHADEPHGDPHFWTSVVGARAVAQGIYEQLCRVYPEHKEAFGSAYDALLEEIRSIEQECEELFATRVAQSFVIYHPSLSYFAAEWGLHQIVIEQDGKEPTPLHLKEITEQAKAEGARVVFVQREFDKRNAESVAEALGARLYEIDPLSSDWPAQMRHILAAFK